MVNPGIRQSRFGTEGAVEVVRSARVIAVTASGLALTASLVRVAVVTSSLSRVGRLARVVSAGGRSWPVRVPASTRDPSSGAANFNDIVAPKGAARGDAPPRYRSR